MHTGSLKPKLDSQFSSVVSDSAGPWTAAHQVSLSITSSPSFLKFMSVESGMPSNHLTLGCPLLLISIFPSIRVFSNGSVLRIRWPKYWSFSFIISPSNAYSGLISLRIDWFELLVVQGTLKSLIQHHSSKASILLGSVFLIVQLSHPYMTTGDTITLTYTNLCQQMALLFNDLSRFVTAFLSRSKHLLISWLHSLSSVTLEPKKTKSVIVSTFPPLICHEVMGLDAMILAFCMLSFKPAISLSSFTLIKRIFSSSSLSASRVVSST